jgi:hypothetical protein
VFVVATRVLAAGCANTVALSATPACVLLSASVSKRTGGDEMYHNIQFRLKGLAELESPGSSKLEQLVIQQGTRLRAEIKPYVVETTRGPVEVADLYLEDGSIARAVRFATFSFVDG